MCSCAAPETAEKTDILEKEYSININGEHKVEDNGTVRSTELVLALIVCGF